MFNKMLEHIEGKYYIHLIKCVSEIKEGRKPRESLGEILQTLSQIVKGYAIYFAGHEAATNLLHKKCKEKRFKNYLSVRSQSVYSF